MRARAMVAMAFTLGVMSATELRAATTYTYDDLGRLKTVTYDNGKVITYSYDPAGNRTTVVTQTP